MTAPDNVMQHVTSRRAARGLGRATHGNDGSNQRARSRTPVLTVAQSVAYIPGSYGRFRITKNYGVRLVISGASGTSPAAGVGRGAARDAADAAPASRTLGAARRGVSALAGPGTSPREPVQAGGALRAGVQRQHGRRPDRGVGRREDRADGPGARGLRRTGTPLSHARSHAGIR
ncbi:Hypothetical predicted protein, partial [Olea europaea subsp. europaea]